MSGNFCNSKADNNVCSDKRTRTRRIPAWADNPDKLSLRKHPRLFPLSGIRGVLRAASGCVASGRSCNGYYIKLSA